MLRKVLFVVLACLIPIFIVVSFMCYTPSPRVEQNLNLDYYITSHETIEKYIFCENTMYVYLDKSLNERDVENTKEALQELDEILTHQTIQFVDEIPHTNHYVYVEKCDLEEGTVGFCSRAYPKRIQIHEKLSNYYWASDKTSCFAKVIQHEFGHVLGLADLYQEEYSTMSVMYYVYNSNHGNCAHRYTKFDIENIQGVYC